MRIRCFECGDSVTNELPNNTIFRAIATCPDCIKKEGDNKNDSKSDNEELDNVDLLAGFSETAETEDWLHPDELDDIDLLTD